MRAGGVPRVPIYSALSAREWRSVGRIHVFYGSGVRAPRGAAVGTRKWLSVESTNMLLGGVRRLPRGAAVCACERVSAGQSDADQGGGQWTWCYRRMGKSEQRTAARRVSVRVVNIKYEKRTENK